MLGVDGVEVLGHVVEKFLRGMAGGVGASFIVVKVVGVRFVIFIKSINAPNSWILGSGQQVLSRKRSHVSIRLVVHTEIEHKQRVAVALQDAFAGR